ncbi:helix-turn-helix domain-containing protein [Amycolatopsis rhabdoformis]|uniref:Helix-turn-helix domain-containing protein n=1 Tax=Amycolatopsis rhabdoformis TaxID=1448059 RepID=A0ABZ1IJZ7_9PSEU|nr:helix-turn-helix domain-containing protein [Amycolatopsis rhabdoformis]WSE34558.1 helix-turn-helix domain-containing protein [Amycolatopsis rhabdoformis]
MKDFKAVRTDVRRTVAETPSACAQWGDRDADFIREILDLVGDKWSVALLGILDGGALRYSDLAAAVPGISQRMLTLTLKQLQRDGFVRRISHAEVPPRVEYGLTTLGASLLSAVLGLAGWSAENQVLVRRSQAEFDADNAAEGDA